MVRKPAVRLGTRLKMESAVAEVVALQLQFLSPPPRKDRYLAAPIRNIPAMSCSRFVAQAPAHAMPPATPEGVRFAPTRGALRFALQIHTSVE